MNDRLKEKANEVSLMLVMTSEQDAAGVRLVLDLCDELAKIAAAEGKNERLVAAVDFLKKQEAAPRLFAYVQEFASAALTYLENAGDAVFPNEREAPAKAECNQTTVPGESVDPRFLTEYIETHSLLLDELESNIISFRDHPENPEEFGITVKRYLHNLKGDSGSIGLVGIEHVCHTVEDLLADTAASEMLTQLLSFKEWVVACLERYAGEKSTPASAEDFLKSLSASIPRAAVEPAISGAVKVSPPGQELGEYKLSGEREILIEFSAEAEEHLLNVESVILDAEGVYSKEIIDTIFRGVHSIKGGSAYFNLQEMTKCSHILENMLSEVRDGKRELDATLSSLLLTYIDLQKNVLGRAKQALAGDGTMKVAPESQDFMQRLDVYAKGGSRAVSSTPATQKALDLPVNRGEISSASSSSKAAPDESTDQKGDKLSLKTFVKVDTARLDLLIDSIGEMVIYSSMLIRHCRELLQNNEGVMDATHRVEKFSRDLQDIGMSMRLVPIKGLFQKMSRLVWDMSKKLNKDISFSMEGEDTELDRNLIDKLADPLMHMVRNSLDHGIETPEEREKKGKPRTGKVSLSAYHSGGSIHIKIQDDGKGLNAEKLIAKAVEKGLVQAGQKLSEAEAYSLIFAAGFSTAAVVTDISGRGVGMDVVRRNVESLRGRIHIESKVDVGSTFTIELPLTLAIIDGIQVQVGTESFLLPSLSIVEFVRPKAEMLTNTLDRGETLHFRGRYLPVYRISELYGITPQFENPLDASMVIVENNHDQVAFMVDQILGECSTVIKSLGPTFEDGKGVAGCAIMPKGDVALILDVRSLVQLARADYAHSVRVQAAPTSAEV